MNCVTKLQHAVFTSITVISLFYFIDLLILKYSPMVRSVDPHTRHQEVALAEAALAKDANLPMIRIENMEAALREITGSRREGTSHQDNSLEYYQYKLGLEELYWDNKMVVVDMLERLKKLNNQRVDQSDRDLVQILQRFWLHPPSVQAYDLNAAKLMDFSMGQSDVVDTILNGMRDGFFVECGALDGETRSNSLFFERERNWQGLLIEAGPGNYRQLIGKHRKAYSSPSCLGVHSYPTQMMFHKGRNRGRVLDSQDAFDWVSAQRMQLSVTQVQCFPLYTYLMALNRTTVDYFSLDVEGAELQVLQTIPFNKVTIKVLTVEFKHTPGGKKALFDFMSSKGYRMVAQVTREDGLANDLVFVLQS